MALREFMPHQRDAFHWAASRADIALFMQMRLGKSAVAIRWAASRPALRALRPRRLIVAPLTTLQGWHEELLLEEIPETEIQWLAGCSPATRIRAAGDLTKSWFLINYEAVRRWPGIGLMPWQAVILDESTRIKNPTSQITKVVSRKLFDVANKAILTGLPNPESSLDYFSQMAFVNGGSFMGFNNFWSWRDALFYQDGYDWKPKPGKRDVRTNLRGESTRARIKAAVGELSFVMDRHTAHVGSVLLHEKRVVAPNAAQRAAFRQIKKDFRYHDVETKSAGTQHVWLQRVAGGFSPDREHPMLIAESKFDELLRLLTGELRGEPTVIWFHFNEELAYVYHELKSREFPVVALLGATTLDKRRARIQAFQRGRAQLICVQEALGQFGLDLSRADTEIYYSNAWAYELRAQSQDRIVHPKKTHPLLSIDLITEGSTDEDVVDTLREKSIDSQSFRSKLLERIQARYGD